MKKCYKCEITKELTDFVSSNGVYRNLCKKCQADANFFRIHGHLNREPKNYRDNAQAKKKIEEEGKNRILQLLGYDLDSDISVHKQFLMRYNLDETI